MASLDGAANVYIVDDDADLGASLAWLLETVGIRAVCFVDAIEFLETVATDEPACVIMDLRMPRMSGFEVQAELVERRIPMPIIFCTAHGDVRTSVRALHAGAVDFLEKPYDPQAMVEVVQRNLIFAVEAYDRETRRRSMEARLEGLTPRERDVLQRVLVGESSQRIATALGVSARTVDVHRSRIRSKVGVDSFAGLAGEMEKLDVTP